MKTRQFIPLALAALLVLPGCKGKKEGLELLNVSYDPTREFYAEVNTAFQKKWEADGKGTITLTPSHGGSGKQARSVIDGVQADVVTLALAGDIDAIAREAKLLPEDWQTKLPDNSSPYTSTIVFVVRKGNPKGVTDWGDLVKPGVEVVTPDPKTSGGARWNYLAAWAWADKQNGGDQEKILAYMKDLFEHVVSRDSGARAATTSFAKNKVGDVFLSWENEAYLIEKEFAGQTEIVYPSISIMAEPPVAVVEKNAEKHGTTEAAKAYLNFLYTDEAQDLAGKHFYRPRKAEILAKYSAKLKNIPLVTVDKDFGGWTKAQQTHFADGGTYDQISGVK